LIKDHSHIFWTLYYKDIIQSIHYILDLLPFQAHLDCELVPLNNW
jgi:hypothetical protein